MMLKQKPERSEEMRHLETERKNILESLIIYRCFHVAPDVYTGIMACKAKNSYHMALSRKDMPTLPSIIGATVETEFSLKNNEKPLGPLEQRCSMISIKI